MSKHTPGPWIVTDDVNAHVIRGAKSPHEGNGITFAFRDYVCSIWGGYHEANAHLIAAAPAMLEALEELLASDRADQNAIVGRDVDGHPLKAAGVARMNARAVIRAAKGEA